MNPTSTIRRTTCRANYSTVLRSMVRLLVLISVVCPSSLWAGPGGGGGGGGVTVTVPSSEAGVVWGDVCAGETYHCDAAGTIYNCSDNHPGCTQHPNGIGAADGSFTWPNQSRYSLVGVVNGQAFQLGTSVDFVPPASGTLILYFNDNINNYGDNEGSYVATISPIGGCGASCGGGGGFGGAGYGLGCVDATFNLGKTLSGFSAGLLMIHTNLPGSLLVKPEGLTTVVGTNVEVIRVSSVLRQVRTPEGLVDIVVNNNFRYDLRFYTPLTFSTNKVSDLYPPTSNAFTTITIQDPDKGTNGYSHLQINETGDLGTRQTDYFWVAASNLWQLVTGGGLRKEARSDGPIVTNTVWNADGSVAFQQIEKYQGFGNSGATQLVERIVDPFGPRPLTNLWIYSDAVDENTNAMPRLSVKIEPNGAWERYEYDYQGTLTKTIIGIGDASTNAVEADCHVIEHDAYGGWSWEFEYLQGHLLVWRESYNASGENYESVYDANDALVAETISKWYTGGSFQGQMKSVQHADGTFSLFGYALSADGLSKTTTNSVGAGDEAAITNGTRTITVTDLAGHVLTNQVYDIASGLLIAQDSVAATDHLGRPTMTVHLAGTNTTSYSCCGIDSATDPEGSTTSYTYDALKRVIATTRAGITTETIYDAVDRPLVTIRNGVMISSNVYNVAGELLSTTDALGQSTTHSEAVNGSGETVKTTTYPNGTTRIETYYQDGQLKSVTGTAVHGVRYEYGVEADSGTSRLYTKEIKLNGGDSDEWTKTYTDTVGRAYKTVFPDSSYSQLFYNSKGQLAKQRDPDGVVTLFAYNDRGELETTAIDMDHDDTIDYNGTDRITSTQRSVVNDGGVVKQRATTTVWTANGSGTTLTVGTSDTSASGLESWTITHGLTNHVQTVYLGNGRRTVTTSNPDGSYSVGQYQDGRLGTNTAHAAGGAELARTSYQYDGAGRLTTATDVRLGDTTYTYNNADQRLSATVGGQTTAWQYDSVGRVTTNTLPDSALVVSEYHPTGELKKQFGARTYPVEYDYDYAGRMTELKTWRDYDGGSGTPDITMWNYSATRGFLEAKVYADTRSVTYSNSAAGRLLGRTWARGVITEYDYNNAGELSGIDYLDATPDVSITYDRLGRRITVTNGADVCTYTYNNAGQVLTETFPVAGVTITNTYDNLLRRSVLSSSAGVSPVSYTYDAASRLETVTADTNSATYTYLPNSSLVSNIVFRQGSTTRMTTTKSYDTLNRLTSIASVPSASSAVSYSYSYNSANQRTKRTEADDSYWDYGYDALGQVTSGSKKWVDGSPVSGQQYGYDFDDIGNRKMATFNSRVSTYTVNEVNQYEQRTVPSYTWELGGAASNATVTVNNQLTSRKGEYFAKELSIANSSAAIYTQLVTVGVLKNAGSNQMDIIATTTGKVFVAQSPEAFSYDLDGNLTSDGRWAYSWDGENRLIAMETSASVTSVLATARQKLLFSYDSQSRRVSKVVSNLTSGVWSLTSDLRFVYDGWNLAAELDAANALVRSYTWGLDLSGSLQGAGGIGGLLTATLGTNGTHFVAFDGNGNVGALVDVGSGSVSAQYEYSPFGEMICVTGPIAKANPFRFSTKYTDDEAGLLYYGYRYYQPSTGRWLSRDPMEESGGENLYGFVYNEPIFYVDPDGAKGKKLPPIYTPPTPGKLAACLTKCAVEATLGDWYNSKFEAAKLCGKIKKHCELELALPKASDVAEGVDLTPSGKKWATASKCLASCLGLTGEFDIETESTIKDGNIKCNKKTESVDYSFDILVRLKLVPGDFILKEQKKSVTGSCAGPLGKTTYGKCCCWD